MPGKLPLIALTLTLVISFVAGAWYLHAQPRAHLGTQFQPHQTSSPGMFDPAKVHDLVQSAIQRYATSSSLFILPTQIAIPTATVASANSLSFSYYGMTFEVPWTNMPSSKTSSPNGLFTILNFGSGKIVEAFSASSSIAPIAEGAASAFLAGLATENPGAATSIRNAYSSSFQTNYDFVQAALGSSPAQLSLDDSALQTSVVIATAFLRVKESLIASLAADILPVQRLSAIHSFMTPTINGFEFDGSLSVGTTTERVSHFLIFDSKDKAHDILLQGASPSELGFVLASLRYR